MAPSASGHCLSKANACDSHSHFPVLRIAIWREKKSLDPDDRMESWILLLLEPVFLLSLLHQLCKITNLMIEGIGVKLPPYLNP